MAISRRIVDPVQRREQVYKQCVLEFRRSKRWTHLDPYELASHVDAFIKEAAWDHEVMPVLRDLSKALVNCRELLSRQPPRRPYRFDTPPFGTYARQLQAIEPALHAFLETLLNAHFEEVEKYVGQELRNALIDGNGLLESMQLAPALTRRHAVILVLYHEDAHLSYEPTLPTARELAVANILAGEELPPGGKRGLSVSEVIIKEANAMRGALASLRPQLRRDLRTLPWVTSTIVHALS